LISSIPIEVTFSFAGTDLHRAAMHDSEQRRRVQGASCENGTESFRPSASSDNSESADIEGNVGRQVEGNSNLEV